MFQKTRRFGKEALLQISPAVFWWYVRIRHGYLEPEIALLPRLCLRDRISVDVGANYGIYSYYMLKYSTACIAFEPYPRLAELLRKGLGKRLQVHQAALSDRSGTTQMVASLRESGFNTIEPSNRIEFKVRDPASIVTLEVPVRRLDDFDLGPVGFVKIDVEGHEPEVLAGARETIAAHLPALLIEVEERHRTGSRERLLRQLGEFGYRAFFFQSGRLRPAESFDPGRHQNPLRAADSPLRAKDYVRNFLFIPEHRLDAFAADISPETRN